MAFCERPEVDCLTSRCCCRLQPNAAALYSHHDQQGCDLMSCHAGHASAAQGALLTPGEYRCGIGSAME